MNQIGPFSLFVLLSFSSFSQQKYQSLLWEISGNGLKKPSYLYGTMHVSQKVAFRMGEPFFEALQSVDVVALELEPENWFDHIMTKDDRYNIREDSNEWENYNYNKKGKYNFFDYDINEEVSEALVGDPSLLNYMLFRDYSSRGDFAENTWLDMYIYQAGQKLGKQAVGLETIENTLEMERLADEMDIEKVDEISEKTSNDDRFDLLEQLEPAYRKGNLDLIDSIDNLTSSKGWRTYILFERNKTFVRTIDSLLKKQRVFAGMGAAHLPGDQGVIELLRNMGYTVKPIDMGERDSKSKSKLEKLVLKRSYQPFNTKDDRFTFKTPSTVYTTQKNSQILSYISLDIPNGGAFMVHRKLLFHEANNTTPDGLIQQINDMLFEIVPGTIEKQTLNNISGFPAIDILYKTRRGDYQRSRIIVTDTELIIMRLTARSEMIKNGYGDEFFSSFTYKVQVVKTQETTFLRGQIKVTTTGVSTYLNPEAETNYPPNPEQTCINSKTNKGYYTFVMNGETYTYPISATEELENAFSEFKSESEWTNFNSEITTVNNRSVLRISATTKNQQQVFVQLAPFHFKNICMISFDSDEQRRNDFFNSLSLQQTSAPIAYPYTDSTLFFKAELPFDQNKKATKNNYNPFLWAELTGESVDSLFLKEFNGSKTLNNQSNTEAITVAYRRHGRYDQLYKENFISKLHNEVTYFNQFEILDSSEVITDNSLRKMYLYSMPGSAKQFRILYQQFNQSEYILTSAEDRQLGQSPFSKMFYDSFQPVPDSLASYSLWDDKDDEMIKDLVKADSATFHQLFGYFENQYFMSETMNDRIANLCVQFPSFGTSKQQDELERYYLKSFIKNTVPKDYNDIETLYATNADDAGIQERILSLLLANPTKESVLLAKKLLLNDPPIEDDDNGWYLKWIADTSLAALLMPDIIELTAIPNYRKNIYAFTGMCIDSNYVKKALFISNVDQFLREAKIQYKGLNQPAVFLEPTSRMNPFKYQTEFPDIEPFMHLVSLLHNYREIPEVKTFLEEIRLTRNKQLLAEYLEFLSNKKENVESFWYATLNKTKDKDLLLKYFQNINKIEIMGDSAGIRKILAEYQITTNNTQRDDFEEQDQGMDSLTFVTDFYETIRNRRYHFFEYKYRSIENDYNLFSASGKKRVWRTEIVAIPVDLKQLNQSIKKYNFEVKGKTPEENEETKLQCLRAIKNQLSIPSFDPGKNYYVGTLYYQLYLQNNYESGLYWY